METYSIILTAGIVMILISIFLIREQVMDFELKSFEERRKEILSKMNFMLEESRKEGKYKCCIEPPCKMCFLGDWIWKDGVCNCEAMIEMGEWNKVCPECKNGIKEGRCTSRNLGGICPVFDESE